VDVEWHPTVPSGQTGPKVNFNDEFDKFQVMQVYYIKRTIVRKEDAAKINNVLTYVMTGNDNYVK
jgi:hypothetical protein